MRTIQVRISDSVLDEKDWPVWELIFLYNKVAEKELVCAQRIIHLGAYGQDFTGWDIKRLAKWSFWDSTGSHPENNHRVYVPRVGRWEAFKSTEDIVAILDAAAQQYQQDREDEREAAYEIILRGLGCPVELISGASSYASASISTALLRIVSDLQEQAVAEYLQEVASNTGSDE